MPQINARAIRVILSVLVGAALAAALAFVQTRNMQPALSGVAGAPIGGHFAGLVDHNGKTVAADAFQDKFQMVFFGFTHCPAICPTEMQRMSYILKRLPDDMKSRAAAVFVTVDPARDTPAQLKDYLRMFDPGIIGLSGSDDDLALVRKEWKVYAARVTEADKSKESAVNGDYMMDHSAFLYLRGPDGTLQGLYGPDESAAQVLEQVKAVIGAAIRAEKQP